MVTSTSRSRFQAQACLGLPYIHDTDTHKSLVRVYVSAESTSSLASVLPSEVASSSIPAPVLTGAPGAANTPGEALDTIALKTSTINIIDRSNVHWTDEAYSLSVLRIGVRIRRFESKYRVKGIGNEDWLDV